LTGGKGGGSPKGDVASGNGTKIDEIDYTTKEALLWGKSKLI